MANEQMLNELEARWRLLAPANDARFRQASTDLKIEGRNVGVAVDPTGARHVLIPASVGAPGVLWKSAAVELSRKKLSIGDAAAEWWLLLSCKRPDLDGLFLRVAARTLEHLPQQLSIVPGACCQALEPWRELLGPPQGPAFSLTDAVGLIGELLVLDRLAQIDPVRALEAWQGPLGGRHDFRLGPHAIEVKATLRRVGRIVSVSGVEQLEAPRQGTLHLSWIRLERVIGGNVSISKLIEALVIRGVMKHVLSERLSDLRYPVGDPEIADLSFELAEWLLWSVDGGFPRIVPQQFAEGRLPPGVVELDYKIDLSGPVPAPLDHDSAEAVWRQLFQ